MPIKKVDMRLGNENIYSKTLQSKRDAIERANKTGTAIQGQKVTVLGHIGDVIMTKLRRIAFSVSHLQRVNNTLQGEKLLKSLDELSVQAQNSLKEKSVEVLRKDVGELREAINQAGEIIELLGDAAADKSTIDEAIKKLVELRIFRGELDEILQVLSHKETSPFIDTVELQNLYTEPLNTGQQEALGRQEPAFKGTRQLTTPVEPITQNHQVVHVQNSSMQALAIFGTKQPIDLPHQLIEEFISQGKSRLEFTLGDLRRDQSFISQIEGQAHLMKYFLAHQDKKLVVEQIENSPEIRLTIPTRGEETASFIFLPTFQVRPGLVELNTTSPFKFSEVEDENPFEVLPDNSLLGFESRQIKPDNEEVLVKKGTPHKFSLVKVIFGSAAAIVAAPLLHDMLFTQEASKTAFPQTPDSLTPGLSTGHESTQNALVEVRTQWNANSTNATQLESDNVSRGDAHYLTDQYQNLSDWTSSISHVDQSSSSEYTDEPNNALYIAGLVAFFVGASTIVVGKATTSTASSQIAPPTAPRADSQASISSKAPLTMKDVRELAKIYGWKTANLMYLKSVLEADPTLRATVPDFGGIEHVAVLNHIKQHYSDFDRHWETYKKTLSEHGDLEACKPILETLQANIKSVFAKFPMQHKEIAEFARKNKALMVRSSGREDDPGEMEDGSDAVNNPGGNLSLANVTPSEQTINEAIGNVVASYFSFNSINQRKQIKDDITADPFVPVLLQVMVGEKPGGAVPVSGVMYTREPDLLTENVMFVDVAPGHAENIVTGSAPSDFFYVHKGVVHYGSQEKPTRLVPNPKGGLITKVNSKALAFSLSLKNDEAVQLARIGAAIERGYGGKPQDVEWTYDPSDRQFYIFQTRGSKSVAPKDPSYIDPEKINRLKDRSQVLAPVKAVGARAITLNCTNAVAVESADAAKDYCSKNPYIKTIILKSFIRKNSHEAGYFRSLGISVINPKPGEYNKLAKALKTETLIVDVQQEIIGIVPEGESAEDYIIPGLRRHLASKMESNGAKLSKDQKGQFLNEIRANAEGIDSTLIMEKVEATPGRNLMDKYLNAYEAAVTDAERAFILKKDLRGDI